MRLCFSGLTPDVIDAGMHRLGDQMKAAVRGVKPVF